MRHNGAPDSALPPGRAGFGAMKARLAADCPGTDVAAGPALSRGTAAAVHTVPPL